MNNTLYNINNVNIDSYDCLKPSTLNKAMILKSISFINVEKKMKTKKKLKKNWHANHFTCQYTVLLSYG